MSRVISLLCLFSILICGLMVSGCDPAKAAQEPIERSAQALITEVVKPAVEKAASELSARTAQYQGQGSLINPGYRVQGYGMFGTGIGYNFEINTVGLSANIAGSTQQDAGQEGTVPPPAMRDDKTTATPTE